jgi:enoyl-CoA hydratase
MSDQKGRVGQIRTETYGRIFKIIIDNASKKNSFSPR